MSEVAENGKSRRGTPDDSRAFAPRPFVDVSSFEVLPAPEGPPVPGDPPAAVEVAAAESTPAAAGATPTAADGDQATARKDETGGGTERTGRWRAEPAADGSPAALPRGSEPAPPTAPPRVPLAQVGAQERSAVDTALSSAAAALPALANPGVEAMADRLADEMIARLDARTARILVVGQGYVGLPVAMRAVEQGFPVAGLEAARPRVEALRAGRSYVSDVPDEVLRTALQRGYLPSDDPSETGAFDVAVITVPTPLRDGAPDLSHVEAAAEVLARRLRTGTLVILESTTYPGTTDELVRPILERASGLRAGTEFFVGYSPERIDPGNPNYGFVNTPKVVSGVDDRSRRCVEAFYGALVDKVVPVRSTAEAELVKLLENTFRHVNIALMNELAMFAADLDIDLWNAIDAASTKPFGYMRFTPGPGVGGHCLPIDPSYLSWRVRRRLGQTFRFVELANDVNEHMPDYVVTRVVTLLNRESRAVRGSRILALGLSYKAGTSDWRESPSIAVVERLLALGADIRACEPYMPEAGAPELPVPVVDCTREQIAEADLVLLLVDHPDFPLDEIASTGRLVLDTKGVMRHHTFNGETL